MASSLETLVKILKLEQRKGYKNDAVIGGFGRFARHWAREAHGQAKTDAHTRLVDDIADDLRRYDALNTPEERADLIDVLLEKATGQITKQEAEIAAPTPPKVEEAAPAETPEPPPAPPEPEAKTEPPAAPKQPEARKREEAPRKPRPKKQRKPRPEPARSLRERRGYAEGEFEISAPATEENLSSPVSTLSGVGVKRAQLLERLGVTMVSDILYLFPHRHEDFSRLKTIDRLEIGEEITVVGTVGRVSTRKTKRGQPILEAVINDGTAALSLTWFNQPWLSKQIYDGRQIVVSGKVDQYLGRLTMTSPEWEPMERDWLHTGRVVPVYPLTKDLTARVMRQIMKRVSDEWSRRLADYLPLDIRERLDMMDLGDAIAQVHFPDSWDDLQAARARLAFDELFILHLSMVMRRQDWQADTIEAISVEDAWLETFQQALPYQLTGAQQRALNDIRQDLESGVPMNRLLQGDVGSGKTVVAATAIAMALSAGKQAALMAPTGILCEQHYAALSDLLSRIPGMDDQPPSLRLLTGSLSDAERQEVYDGLADGSIQVVVGTHALIQAGVEFADLGLAVIDEQHRFGVHQRGTLRGKAAGGNPHLLVMTATPIPRTLALTIHADLDLTLLDEMPPGRQEVETRVLSTRERERSYAFLRSQIEQGRQVFIVHPLVEESEKIEAKSAVAEFERLQKEVFADLRLGLLHGQMKPAEKEQAMAQFYNGEIDILVSTTVIEVGIDVPNASVMMVENANRFGLAQLHQLRGRVGRGEHRSYCLLISDADGSDPLGVNGGSKRLAALEETNDGFRLAEIDWEMRGAGDLLGTRQSGFVGRIHFANLMDPHLVESVQREVETLVKTDPHLQAPQHAPLAERVARAQARQDPAYGDIS
jgi:ATP-dependent DNA helicase RecG